MTLSLVLLEVMDKEPSLPIVWYWNLGLGVVAFMLGPRSRIGWALVVTLLALNGLASWEELHDPFVGPAIMREAGRGYFVQTYVATAAGGALALAGLLRRFVGDPSRFRSGAAASPAAG